MSVARRQFARRSDRVLPGSALRLRHLPRARTRVGRLQVYFCCFSFLFTFKNKASVCLNDVKRASACEQLRPLFGLHFPGRLCRPVQRALANHLAHSSTKVHLLLLLLFSTLLTTLTIIKIILQKTGFFVRACGTISYWCC